MAKIVKLTEAQLAKIINSVIKESSEFGNPGIKQQNLNKFLRKLNNRPETSSGHAYNDDWMADLAFRDQHPHGKLDGRMRSRDSLDYIQPMSNIGKKKGYKSPKFDKPDYAEDTFSGMGAKMKHDDPQDEFQTDKGVPLTSASEKYKASVNKHAGYKKDGI